MLVEEYIAPPSEEVTIVTVIALNTIVCEAPSRYIRPPYSVAVTDVIVVDVSI